MGAFAAKTVVSWTGPDGHDHDGPLLTRAKGFDIIACAVCGFSHVVPLPEASGLERPYRENLLETPGFPPHAHEAQEWTERAHQDRLDQFERLLPAGRRRLLDAGCGAGFFLKTAKARGWQALGIESSPQTAAHARSLGVDVVEGFFNEECVAQLGRFDALHLNTVLDYVSDPADMLARARKSLSPGGLLCVDAPKDGAPFDDSALSEEGAAPHRLNYFDGTSLIRLMTQAGFALSEKPVSFPMDARGAFYRALAEAGMGHDAVLIAIKR